MRVGISMMLTNAFQRPFGDSIMQMAQQVEQAGFSTLGVADHFALRSPRRPEMADWYESWSTLAFVAACTKRIRLTTMVSGITLRDPVALIKTVNTVDALSQGRACLSVGASPNFGADEHRRIGLPFPAAGERIARLEEALQIALQLWSGEDKPFEGRYYQLSSTAGTTMYVQQPHPPILIAGNGPKMLQLMAKYADVVNIGGFGESLDELGARLATLRQQCEALGRPYEQIEKTTLYLGPVMQDGQINAAALDRLRTLGEMGFEEVLIALPDDLTGCAELAAAVGEIAVGKA